jgi:hypothetical protein
MDEKKVHPKKLSLANTKQDMLEAYQSMVKQLEAQRELELKPEKRIEERKAREAIQVAESLSSDGISKEIAHLKVETGKMLAQVADRLEEEIGKFKAVQSAIEVKQKELQEVYEIEKAAVTLSALIESQNQRRETFESEMAMKKEESNRELEDLRARVEKEESDYELMVKERDTAEKKRRDREKEEYDYGFKREQKLAKDKFEDEKAKLEKEILAKREQTEGELKAREKAIAAQEAELKELKAKQAAFPKELEAAAGKAVKEVTERLNAESKNREELQKRESLGEKNVLTTRIEALEKRVKEQNDQIARLGQQLESAYQQVQDVAVKTIEGSSNAKSLATLQQWLGDQIKRPSQEK